LIKIISVKPYTDLTRFIGREVIAKLLSEKVV